MTVARRRRAALAVLAGLVTAAAAAAVLVLVGSEGGDGAGTLAWDGAPRVATVAALPSDRILVGRVRNTSLRPARLEADDVRILQADGSALSSTARFSLAFAHPLYSPRDAPAEVSAHEDRRLGRVVTVGPGQSVPVTLSWRLERDGRRPVAARLGASSLRLPQEP